MQKIQRFAQPFFGRRINSKRRIQNKTRIELAAIDHLESRVLLSSTNPTGISEDGSDIAKSPFLEFETNWAVSFGGASDDEGDRILTDLSGSVFVHGTYEGLVDFAPGTAEYFLDSGSEPGIFLAMYNSDGILNWAHHLGASDDIRPTEITLDGSGNVLLTGWFYNTVDFDPGPGENNLTSRRFDDCFIAKYDREGNHLWAKSFRGQSANKGYVVRSDSEDNVYIGGRFHSRNDVDPGPNVLELSSKGESDMLLVKLDANGDLVWGNSFGSYYDDRIYHLEVDGDGNIFIAGHFALTVDFDPSEEVYNLSSSNNSSEIFLAKYDTDGNFVWVRSFSGPGDNDSEGVKLDAEGNIYLVGYFEGTVDFDPGEGTHFLTSVGDYDCFVAKLDSEGNLIWVNQAGGPGRDENGSVELDSEGNVYVHGFFSGIADFNPGLAEYFLETENEESRHIWVMDNDGQFLYATRVIDDDKARVGSTSLYKDSQFLTTGSFVDGADFDSGPDVVNLTNNGGTDAFIATFDHPQYLAVDLNTNRILGITGATVTNSGAFRTQAETTVTFTTDKGTVTSNGNGEFSWTYTPTYEDRGIHKVTITATGSNGVETTVSFKLLVDILQTFDGTTNDFFTETNPAQWLRTGEKYQVDSTDTDGLGISLMDHFVSLPSSFEMSAEIMALSGVDRWFDGFLIFDYQSETDFKYAGYFAGQNQWVIGHFQGNFNNRLSQIDWDDVGRSINLDTPYMLHLSIDGSVVKLSVDGEVITSTTFATPITSPKIGLANKNGVTQFDNFTAGMTAPKQQSILPYVNDFETGDTSELNFVGSHRWSVRNQNGGQKLVFNGANQYGLGVAYLNVEGLMPSKYEIVAKVAAHDGSNVWHDGFLIFDYQGPNDFKYAGMFVGQNEWVIGHYQGNWGNRLAVYDLDALGLSLNAHQEYTLLVEIDELDVDLYVNGIRRLSATFEDGIYQGPAGVAGYNSYTSFDNLEIGSRVSYGHPVSGNYYEDFDDNKADYFQYKDPQNWAVVAGAGKTVLRTNTSSNDQLSVAYVPLDLASAKSGFSIEVDILSHDVSSGWRDGFIIFDYKNENDFKYAGMFVGQNELTIGHYQGDWTNRLRSTTGEAFRRPLQTERWYRMEVRISGDIAELRINGYYMIDVRFDEPIYNGSVGLAADKAFTWFDNFKLTTLPSAAPTDSLFASWKEEEDELLI